jgi:hypothetical protein
LRNRLHKIHHIGIVGPLTVGVAAHRLGQIFVAQAGQPRRRRAANEVLLMTNLAYNRCGGDAEAAAVVRAGQLFSAK